MKDEIIGGLKNALERGYSLEQAVASFINAGYNPKEVQAAAESLSQGAITITSPASFQTNSSQTSQNSPQNPLLSQNVPPAQPPQQPKLNEPVIQQPQIPQANQKTPLPSYSQPTKINSSSTNKNKIIILLIIFIFLLALLILSLIFGDKIIALFSSSE